MTHYGLNDCTNLSNIIDIMNSLTMVLRASHHLCLSSPVFYPTLQIRTFEFSVWLHIFDWDLHMSFGETDLCSFSLQIDSVPPANPKRAAVQRPETVGTHLMLGIVDSSFVHTINKLV